MRGGYDGKVLTIYLLWPDFLILTEFRVEARGNRSSSIPLDPCDAATYSST